MSAFLQWLTANPVRAFLAAGLASLLAMLPLPGAWLPGSVIALGLLVGGPAIAGAAACGAAIACLWAIAPAFGALPAAAVALVLVVPALLGAVVLEKGRSLSVAFQALTIGSGLLVLAINGLLGDPVRALAPVIAKLEPWLRELADSLSRAGHVISAKELGEQTASYAWASFGWMVLFNAGVAQCLALWGYGRLREPGLFGREFRALRLGNAVAWLLAGLFLATIGSNAFGGGGWQAVDDLQFVLAAAFLVQALAVVHGLRELQVIGVLPVVLAYVAVVLVPMALVAIGFADTWVRFRERFAPRQGV
jgi:hypothetical protein